MAITVFRPGRVACSINSSILAAFMVGPLTEDKWMRKCVAIGY
jgi:hypothetical protein